MGTPENYFLKKQTRISRSILPLALCIPEAVFGGTADPSGVSGLLFLILGGLILFLPMLILVWLGSTIGGRLGAKIGFGIFLVGLGVFGVIAYLDDHGLKEQYAKRLSAIEICKAELPNVQPEYVVDSLLLDTGIVEKSMLIKLLGERGVNFVELKSRKLPSLKENTVERWGVIAVNGDFSSTYLTPSSDIYVRFSLTKKDDPQCQKQDPFSLGLEASNAPFSPDACVRVEESQKASASHLIQSRPKDGSSEYIHWSLIERESGKVLIGLTSSDNPDSPVRQETGDEHELKRTKFGAVSCRQPYFSMLNAISGHPGNSFPRLSLQREKVQPQDTDDPNINGEWQEISADEILIDRQHRIENLWGDDWVKAFRMSQEIDVNAVGSELIKYNSGKLISLNTPRYKGKLLRGYTVASRDGFLFTAHYSEISESPTDSLLLLRFALDGSIRWRGIVRSTHEPDDHNPFSPSSVTWEREVVRIYGGRNNKMDNRYEHSMLTVQTKLMP